MKASILQCSAIRTGKTIALTIRIFVSKVISLLFNTLSRFVVVFLRSKCLSMSWLQSPSAVILEPKKIKSATVSTFTLFASQQISLPQFPGCWHNTLNSYVDTKDFSSHSNTSRLSAQSHGAMQRAGDACTCGRLQYRQGTLSGRNPTLLRTVSLSDLHGKETLSLLYWTVNKPDFCSGGRYYIYPL